MDPFVGERVLVEDRFVNNVAFIDEDVVAFAETGILVAFEEIDEVPAPVVAGEKVVFVARVVIVTLVDGDVFVSFVVAKVVLLSVDDGDVMMIEEGEIGVEVVPEVPPPTGAVLGGLVIAASHGGTSTQHKERYLVGQQPLVGGRGLSEKGK